MDKLDTLRTSAVRRADALADLVSQVLRHGDLPTTRGARPHLIVTITEQTLFDGKGLGITTTGEHLSRRRGPPDLLATPM